MGGLAVDVGVTAATVAVGPLIAVVVAGSAVSLFVSRNYDTKEWYKIVANLLAHAEENIQNEVGRMTGEYRRVEREYRLVPIGTLHGLFGIPQGARIGAE